MNKAHHRLVPYPDGLIRLGGWPRADPTFGATRSAGPPLSLPQSGATFHDPLHRQASAIAIRRSS